MLLCFLWLCLFNLPSGLSQTSNPVVLVHGLAAFAATWTYKYKIEDEGFQVFAVDIGKFTSNWDRACETFAQIKGTRVDYGVCHSQQFGHQRFGADYTGQGLYPEWDADHKIHLWAHSMGGQTARLLERMLRDGSGCSEDTSPLFQGGKNWVTSISTMSSPHDGTTLTEIFDDFGLLDLIQNLVVAIAGLIDNSFLDAVYTIDFAQWGVERAPGESFSSYWDRVVASGLLSEDNEDISLYDFSPVGAKQLNAGGPLAYEDTYYFSIATERTFSDRDCFLLVCGDWHEDPSAFMTIFLQPTADLMGSYGTQDYQKNDGLVPWKSQLCPTNTEADRANCVEYDGNNWQAGQWTYIGVDDLDHVQIIIYDIFNAPSAAKVYRDHARRLKALPNN